MLPHTTVVSVCVCETHTHWRSSRNMSSTKMCLALLAVAGLCGITPVAADPSQRVARQATNTQGGAVLFFASYEGSLRDLLFDPIIFNQVVVNQGFAYDAATGRFTAPVAGTYQLVFAAQLCRANHNNSFYFVVNGDQRMSCLGQVSGGDTTRVTCFFMEELSQGDQVWIRQRQGSCAWASSVSRTINFSGVLLATEGVSRLGEKSSPCSLYGLPRDVKAGSTGGGVAVSSVSIPLLLCCVLLH